MLEKYKKLIRKFYQKNRRMPSYSEIMEISGLKSKNSVFKLVNRLEEDKFLEKDSKGKLIPRHILEIGRASWRERV